MLVPGINYNAVEAEFIDYVFGASTCDQAALYQLGPTRHPNHEREQQLRDGEQRALPSCYCRPRLRGPRCARTRLRAYAWFPLPRLHYIVGGARF